MGATGEGLEPESPGEHDQARLPGGIVGPDGHEGARAAAGRVRGQLSDLADEAESKAKEEFEQAVLDALAPPPPLIQQARLAAHAEAGQLSGHPWVSLPIPRDGAVAFLLGVSSDDDEGALVSLPLADAYVNLETLAATVDRLSPPADADEPSIPLPASAARELPTARGTAYWLELVELADRLAVASEPLAGDLDRFDVLFRFLIPEQLYPHYERLNPGYFDLLAEVSGRGPLAQVDEAPPVNNDYLPTDPAMFDIEDLEEIWNFDCASLVQAAKDAGLSILEGSVLPVSWDTISEAFETVAGVSPAEWLRDLAALAEPGWQIRVRGISESGRIRATYSIARAEPHAWVCTDDGADGCQVTIGAGPGSAYRLAVAPLLGSGIGGTAEHFVQLAAADVARLLAMPTDLFGMLAAVQGQLPLPRASTAPVDALDPLRLPAPLAAIASMDSVRAAVVVTSTDLAATGVTATGLLAVATGGGFWLFVPAEPWGDTIGPDAPVLVYSASRDLLAATVGKLVGLPNPPVLEPQR